jgi:hypothetical protein
MVLPLLVLLLLLGIDFGRVYFMNINLRNAAHEATMYGGIEPDAACSDLKAIIDREMGRAPADGAICGSGFASDVVYITSFACERTDPGTPCTPWSPPYSADAELRFAVELRYRFQPVVPFVGLLAGQGLGDPIPMRVENRSPVLIGYEGQ